MRAILHETMTGEFVAELGFVRHTWSQGICRPDKVSVTMPGYTGKKWYQYMVPHKYTISIVEDDRRVRAAGILGIPSGEDDKDGIHHVIFPGTGIESYFDDRRVLPYPYDPLVNSGGYPITSRDTNISGVQYGTLMKRLYQQALSHPGATMPVRFETDRAGTRERGYAAIEGKGVQAAVADLSELVDGVEWDWVPTIDDNDNLTWVLTTATDSEVEISSAFWNTWQTGGTEPDVRGLQVKVSPEFMCSTAIFTGGKDDDRVMVARAHSLDLTNIGIPIREVWDSSHSSVSKQATLNGWAQKRHAEGQAPVQYWGLQVRASRAYGLRKGDWCTIEVEDHWLIPDGSYDRRIVEVSGDEAGDWFGVVVAGELSW